MQTEVEIGDISVQVVRKNIRNLHLSVHPPMGAVRIAAPDWMEMEAIRLFAIAKLGWIKCKQKQLREQEREPPREYIERESHYVWGRRYLLHVVEKEAAPSVELKHRQLQLQVRPGATAARREAILEDWYRDRIRNALPALLAEWEPVIGCTVANFYVQRMKTRWGSCNTAAGNIRLNTELARKPPECLEYVVVHELVHLREPTHNDRFARLMNQLMPHWRDRHDMLNRLPVREERWSY
jgi:predicted metal-dependent hydrolase